MKDAQRLNVEEHGVTVRQHRQKLREDRAFVTWMFGPAWVCSGSHLGCRRVRHPAAQNRVSECGSDGVARVTIRRARCPTLRQAGSPPPRLTRPSGFSGRIETATAGPRTVPPAWPKPLRRGEGPVRSSIAGGKAQECSRPPRPCDVLRAGTARAPVGVVLRGRHSSNTLKHIRRRRGRKHAATAILTRRFYPLKTLNSV